MRLGEAGPENNRPPRLTNIWLKPRYYAFYKNEDMGEDNGRIKTREVQLKRPHIAILEVGDILQFNNDPTCRRTISGMRDYATLDEIPQDDLPKIDPDPEMQPDQLLDLGRRLFRPEDVRRFGFRVFELGK